jgi:hypothetical protein
MTPEQLYSAYAMDRRLIGLPGYDVERFPHLTCFTPLLKDREGLIAFASLDPRQSERQISQQVEYFSLVGVPFRWRIMELDGSPDLRKSLTQCGFVTTTRSALMVHTLAHSLPMPRTPKGLRMVHVSEPEGVRDVLALYSVAFGRSHANLLAGFCQQVARDPDTLSLYCVYAGERPIAAAWTEFPRGSQFPELHPEAILPSWRKPEVIQWLTLHRLNEVHIRLYDRAMAVVHPENIAAATAFGFSLVTLRYTMRTADDDPWRVARERKEQIELLRRRSFEPQLT